MKTKKKILLIFFTSLLLIFQSTMIMATPITDTEATKEYLPDGSYFETIIEANSNLKSTIKNASKTTIYRNANGEALWYAKVTANFYYDGTTSSCTSASASSGSYVSTWKILSQSSSRTGNVGSATVTAGAYMGGLYVGSMSKTVLISCDKNGNLS